MGRPPGGDDLSLHNHPGAPTDAPRPGPLADSAKPDSAMRWLAIAIQPLTKHCLCLSTTWDTVYAVCSGRGERSHTAMRNGRTSRGLASGPRMAGRRETRTEGAVLLQAQARSTIRPPLGMARGPSHAGFTTAGHGDDSCTQTWRERPPDGFPVRWNRLSEDAQQRKTRSGEADS